MLLAVLLFQLKITWNYIYFDIFFQSLQATGGEQMTVVSQYEDKWRWASEIWFEGNGLINKEQCASLCACAI